MALQVRTQLEKDGGYAACAFDDEARWTVSVARSGDEDEAAVAALDLAAEALSRGVVGESVLECRTRQHGESYEEYLDWHGLLGGGFAYRELVVERSRRHALPADDTWSNIVGTVALAHLLRSRLVERGGSGLVVRAAQRVSADSPGSKHAVNAALDLDLIRVDYGMASEYLELGARIWMDHEHLRIGVGSYHPAKIQRTRRLHIDTKVRSRRACWQHHRAWKAEHPAIMQIARRL